MIDSVALNWRFLLFSICCAFIVFIFALMFYKLINHHISEKSTAVCIAADLFWSAIPVLILFALLLPSLGKV